MIKTYTDIPGMLGTKKAEQIKQICTDFRIYPEVIVEIGCLYGQSTAFFADLFPKSSIYTFDIHTYVNFDFADLSWGNEFSFDYIKNHSIKESCEFFLSFFRSITFYDTYCYEVIGKKLDIIPDLVFIDDNHRNPGFRKNLRFLYSLMKPGSLIIGDDYKEYSTIRPSLKFDIVTELNLLSTEFEQTYHVNTELWWMEKICGDS